MDLPKLAIAALGGTVSMKARHINEGVIPMVNGEALLASVPELKTLARVNVETLGMLPSASVDFEFLLSVLSWASFQIKQGAAGVVITQGTDALEEVATFFDHLWQHDQPLVLTGAMRSAAQAGADGPANLLDACRVALAASSRQRGVQVVIHGQIHQASAVRKTDSLALQAFSSPNVGPAGLWSKIPSATCDRPPRAKSCRCRTRPVTGSPCWKLPFQPTRGFSKTSLDWATQGW